MLCVYSFKVLFPLSILVKRVSRKVLFISGRFAICTLQLYIAIYVFMFLCQIFYSSNMINLLLNCHLKQVELSHPNAELRLLEVFYHKIYKVMTIINSLLN